MKTTPTRPPNRFRNGGRPPRGPRTVALRPEDKKRVDQLTAAAQHLRETGKDEWAGAVDFVMTPEGRLFVNRLRVDRLRTAEAAGEFGQNLAIMMPLRVREEIKAGVAAAKVTASAEAGKALEAFVAGDFVPERPQRAARGTAEKTGNLNVRVDPELRQRAEDFGADHAAKFGWAPRASHIIAAWLKGRFTEAGRASAE
ncbi:hypothetical protein [Streptomyces sp. NPDC058985]|uniref:hypothetical protein n=1 Tax=Streptomyces sp. NPDC058985 TaxID=3346684 RepID=UPI0036B138FA